MNQNILQGRWKQLKGEARKQWGKLTDDDVDRINGSYQELLGRLQERYGIAQNAAEEQVADWMESLDKSLKSES